MKSKGINVWIRLLLVICSLALIKVLFVPLWRIDLQAPQYPEGLQLMIYPHKLGGNVDIINGLNHYIGMKTLHTADFIEFTILPYCIGFFAGAFLAVGILGRRKLLYGLFILFVSFGVIAMIDFWRWEYNYGHNLNPDAAIIVPGMAYQPPLIGFKQLLNFGAYSIPDTGGWIFVCVGAVLLFCVVLDWRMSKKNKQSFTGTTAIISLILIAGLSSCNTGPQPIKTGTDNCYFCKMTISDARFGAELVTQKGKVFKFDDLHCILSYLQLNKDNASAKDHLYFTNFCGTHGLLESANVLLLKSESFRSPMNGNIAAFDNKDSLLKIQLQYPGDVVSWNQLIKP